MNQTRIKPSDGMNTIKLCECGCGQPTTPSKKTGKPLRFLRNHHTKGCLSPRWNGGKTTQGDYQMTAVTNHSRPYNYDHILIAQRILGEPLPIGAVMHHVDGNPANNQNNNLVICQDSSYHNFLHQRTRAFNACGNANWRSCRYCHKHDDPANLYISARGNIVHHRKCDNEYHKNIRKIRRTQCNQSS